MSRTRSVAEWLIILVPLALIGVGGYLFLSGSLVSSEIAGLPGNGGFFQTPLPAPQQFTKESGDWRFTFTSRYTYVLAGKVTGRHDYPDTLPDGIIPLDIAVANGDLLKPGILKYFTFTMGDHTLRYSYDIPASLGLTEAYIDEHVSNNHLVFLNSTLERQVKSGAAVGSCLVIQGQLVDIRGTSAKYDFAADTSTVRNDTYPEGCEVILVESYTPVAC